MCHTDAFRLSIGRRYAEQMSILNKETLSANAQAAAFEKCFDFVARDPIEIAGDRMFNGAGGDAEIEGPLHIAIQSGVNEPGREGIAGPEAVDDFHFVRFGAIDFAAVPGDGRPGVLPYKGIVA